MSEIRFPKPIRISDPFIKNVFFEDDVYYTYVVAHNVGFDILSPDEQALEEFITPLVLAEDTGENASQDAQIITINRDIETDVDNGSLRLPDSDLMVNIAPAHRLAQGQPVVIKLNVDPQINAGHRHIFTFASQDASDEVVITTTKRQINSKLYDGREPQLLRLNSILQPSRVLVTNQSEELQGIGTYVQMSEVNKILNNMGQAILDQNIETALTSPSTIKPHRYGKEQYALVITSIGDAQSEYKIGGHITIW